MYVQHTPQDSNEETSQGPVIETASATTSPENAKSGSAAYVIAGVALAVLLLLGLLLGGCMAWVFNEAASEYETPGSSYTFNEDLDDIWDEYDEILREYDVDVPTTNRQGEGTASVADVLDFDLAIYSRSLDGEVSASSYAGTPSAVREYTLAIIGVDDDYTQQVMGCLNEAARDEEVLSKRIDEAVALCAKAKEGVEAVGIPSLADDEGGSVADELGSAKSAAARRWELMGEELALLQTEGEVSCSELWDADGKVVEATSDAGDLLEEAMAAAADL